jgi:rfaE bifunctional protein nucleotidyltransferase chain/domain
MVIPLEEFPKLREETLKGKKVVATSGFFDPLHPGHASCIVQSKKFGDILVVILNGDNQCITKKGKPFMPAKDRANVIDYLKEVDYVVIYDHPTRYDSCEPLEIIRPDVFTKGGDRDSAKKVPEVEIIEKYGGIVEYNVGDPKMWSSSNYLEEWYQFRKSQEENN